MESITEKMIAMGQNFPSIVKKIYEEDKERAIEENAEIIACMEYYDKIRLDMGYHKMINKKK